MTWVRIRRHMRVHRGCWRPIPSPSGSRGPADCAARNLAVAWNDRVMIKRVLDLGVQTVLIPYVQNADEARAAVAAASPGSSTLRAKALAG